jgi:hypothetical protein
MRRPVVPSHYVAADSRETPLTGSPTKKRGFRIFRLVISFCASFPLKAALTYNALQSPCKRAKRA